MSYTFSRRDFLKYSALTVVAVAGAGMLSGCEIQDPNNPVYKVGTTITLGNTTARLTLADENGTLDGKFKIRVANGGDATLLVAPMSFTVTVKKTSADGKEETFYSSTLDGSNKLDVTNTDGTGNYSSRLQKGDDVTLLVTANNFALPEEAGCSYTVLFQFFPEIDHGEMSMGWKVTGNVEASSSSDGDNTTEGND